jgi:hypothetical protein
MAAHRELYQMFGSGARPRWAGHTQRMIKGEIVKKIIHSKPEGRRIIGRPKNRWLEYYTKVRN